MRELSVHEWERFTREFATAFAPVIGPDRDIPAPDVGTGPTEMAWIADTFGKHRSGHTRHVVTGKPPPLGGQITAENAKQVSARAILEIANVPVSADADQALRDRGIRIAPDILANSGGVFVSWLEWVQGRTQIPFDEDDVERRLQDRLSDRAQAVIDASAKFQVDFRTAAYILAAQRLARAISAHGDASCRREAVRG